MTILFPFSWINLHGKNGFAEKSKNLARSENNFVWIIKIIMYEDIQIDS